MPIARTAASRRASSPLATSLPILLRSPAGKTLRSRAARTSVFKSDRASCRGNRLAVDDDIEHHRQVVGPTQSRDRRLDILALVRGDLALLEQGQERLDVAGESTARSAKIEALRSAAEIEPAGLDLGQPERSELAGRQPQAIFEERSMGRSTALNASFRRFQAGELGQASDGLEPDARLGIADALRQKRPRIGRAASSRTAQTRVAAARTRASLESSSDASKAGSATSTAWYVQSASRRWCSFSGSLASSPFTQAASLGTTSLRPALFQYSLGLLPRPVFGGLEGGSSKSSIVAPTSRGRATSGPPLRRHAPDPPAGVVAARIAKIDLAMLDDRVVPVGDIDRAVRAHLDVDRPKRDVAALDQLGLLAGRVARAVVGQHEPADPVAAKVIGQEAALPGFGNMTAARGPRARNTWGCPD